MDQIFDKVRTVDPNNSEAVKEALLVFFQNIIKQKEFSCNGWLRELKTIINRFPKYCMPHRANTESYLVNFVNSDNYFHVIEAAKCAHALQQVRPTKEKTATPKSSWRDQMTLLCNSAHSLINAAFPNAVNVYKDTETPQTATKTPSCLAITDITRKMKNVKDKQSLLQIRLKNVLIFIQAMLVEIYPVAKPIRPQMILDVIVRTLSVTSRTNLDVNVTAIKVQALRTLDAIIMCLGSNLISFSPLVIRCVMQTLRWSSDNPSEDARKVRSAAYNTLSNWLNTLHVHRTTDSRNMWEDELTTHIVDDITPHKKIVQLTMGPQPTKHLSKKAKRKLATTQLQESSIASHMPGEKNKIVVSEEINNEVAVAALECAEMFFTVCGRFLKPATHKLIQERIVRECFNNNSYADTHLLYLLRVLEASRKTTPVTVPPPTQYCLHLYSVLVNKQNAEVSKFCTQALLDIRLHLHCSPPSLNFALEVPHEENKVTSTKKQISERNIAVLQSLLGPDNVPTANSGNEIITIIDEPTNKKPRLDVDVTDKISLSSESVQSLEMNEDSDADMEVEVYVNLNESNEVNKAIETTEAIEEISEEANDTQNGHETITKEKILPTLIGITNEIEKKQDKISIYEAPTQIPLNTSTDTIEEDRSVSLEVGYDYPNTGTEKVIVLEKIDDENLPSTNDSDDVQIACGQVIRDVEEVDATKVEDADSANEIPKVNGHSNEDAVNNIDADSTISKVAPKTDVISVEDMLADFVDEVNEAIPEA